MPILRQLWYDRALALNLSAEIPPNKDDATQ
jgi:hypothetical protein